MSGKRSKDKPKGGKLVDWAITVVIILTAGAIAVVSFQNGMAMKDQAPNLQVAGTAPTGTACIILSKEELAPQQGVLFGVNLDMHAKSLYTYSYDLGHKPAVTSYTTNFPLTEEDRSNLLRTVEQVHEDGHMLLLGVQPDKGLASVTDEAVEALANDLAAFNDYGVPVFVNFGEDMNGPWTPWAQQPSAYITAFRRVAAAVHLNAPGSAMMWSPSYGAGYPFTGSAFDAKPGTPDYAALDTDHDGQLTGADDPYSPYYPGDEAVDWVGMSIAFWGTEPPWGENEIPAAGKLTDQLTGRDLGPRGDDSPIPDFYKIYGEMHGKSVAITDTAALYKPGNGAGADELSIKQAWWSQLFSEQFPVLFPRVKMVSWLEIVRTEDSAGGKVDWSVTSTPLIKDAFTKSLPAWLQFGPPEQCTPAIELEHPSFIPKSSAAH
ncbi:hypothetical protein AB0N71_04880 [Pseudarthrobacter enclensis]|uniref:hypothetical protein n=1 Tax=Pseudarthrobacter enclensis TaxID=993070 RepID=UPI0034457D8E